MAKKCASLAVHAADHDWQTQRDLDYLMEAEKIKADPKRYAKAKALAQQRMMDAASIASDKDD